MKNINKTTIQLRVEDILRMNITVTPDGIYDENEMPITIDEVVYRYLLKGGKVERKFEISTVFKRNKDGSITTETANCETIIFK